MWFYLFIFVEIITLSLCFFSKMIYNNNICILFANPTYDDYLLSLDFLLGVLSLLELRYLLLLLLSWWWWWSRLDFSLTLSLSFDFSLDDRRSLSSYLWWWWWSDNFSISGLFVVVDVDVWWLLALALVVLAVRLKKASTSWSYFIFYIQYKIL